jgi:phospholipid/cholesterol/gamma-HCH transport system substrate-binding protein
MENAQEALNGVSSRAGNKLDEVDNLLDRTQELLSRVGVLKDQSEKIMQKLAKGDNSAGLLLQQDSPINKALDKLLLDVDSLLNDIKKNGLDINIDIF